MKHLDKINPNKFYTKLVLEGTLIHEIVSGTDGDGNIVDYSAFEDAIYESEDEGTTLEEYGSAHYFFDGQVYEAVVYIPNNEGTGINELGMEDINLLLKNLIAEYIELGGEIDGFYEDHPWAKNYMENKYDILLEQVSCKDNPMDGQFRDEVIFNVVMYFENNKMLDSELVTLTKKILEINNDAQLAAEIAGLLIDLNQVDAFALSLIETKDIYSGDDWSFEQFDEIKNRLIKEKDSYEEIDLKSVNPKKFYYKIQDEGFYIAEIVYGGPHSASTPGGTSTCFDDAYMENGELKHCGFPMDNRVIHDHGCAFYYYQREVYKFYIHIDSLQVGEVTKLNTDEILEEIPIWFGTDLKDFDNGTYEDAQEFIDMMGEEWVWIKDYFQTYINNLDNNETDISEFNFISLSDLNKKEIPDCAGIYAFRILNINSLPEPFPEILSLKGNRYFYIGQSSKSLLERMYKQELNGKKHGTFFRSLGAILGFFPPKGSLFGRDTRNYKFSKEDILKIVEWLRENIEVGFFTEAENLDQIETDLIKKYTPLLNIQGNPNAIPEISELRKKCVEFAKSE